MQFIKSSLWAGFLIAFKALGSIIINKMVSSYYHNPQVFALLAHFQNLLGIFSSIPADGVNQGVVKYLSDKNINQNDSHKIINAGVWLNGFVFILSATSLFVFKKYLINVFSHGENTFAWIFLILAALLILIANIFFLSVLLAKQHLKLYALLNIISIIFGIGLVYFCIINYSYTVVLFSIGLAPSALFFVNIYIISKNYFPDFKIKLPDIITLKNLGYFILMAASIMVFDRIIDFVVRQYAMSTFTIYQTGLWQSVVKFSDYYIAAFTSLIGMVYYPKISQLINDKPELQKYLRNVLKVSIPLIGMGLLMIFFLRQHILIIFFDAKFIEAEKFFNFQLIGDFLKMISFLLGFIIIAQARTTLFIISQAASAGLYIVLILLCTKEWGMEGFPIAHTLRFAVYSCFIFIIYRKLIFL